MGHHDSREYLVQLDALELYLQLILKDILRALYAYFADRPNIGKNWVANTSLPVEAALVIVTATIPSATICFSTMSRLSTSATEGLGPNPSNKSFIVVEAVGRDGPIVDDRLSNGVTKFCQSFYNINDIESEDSYVSKLNEPDLLVTPLSKLNEDECFDPGGDFVLEEIEACLTSDSIPPGIDDDDFDPEGDILLLEKLLNDDPSSPLPPKEFNFEELKVIKFNVSTDFEDDYYNLEGNIIYLKSLLIKDIIPNLPPEVFLDHAPRSLEYEPDKDDLKNIVKVFDPGIWEKKISSTYVKLPFEDRHYLSLTYVIRIFLPYFTYLVDSSLPLSSGSEDIIFDPGIPVFSFYSLEPVVSHRSGTFMCFNVYLNILNGSPVEICSSTCFVPNIMMIWVESS
ncbi:hypothetical protein Tco_0302872 [Tanacetum coccineum]